MTERATSIQPIKAEGYEVTRFNALRHGVLSRYTVLPWDRRQSRVLQPEPILPRARGRSA
jgi:hypothetical protein